MATKKFTELTREELLEGIIGFIDPEVVGAKKTLETFYLEKEEGAFAIKLRDGKYLRAPIDWTYWDEGSPEPDWVEIPREEFITELRADFEQCSLNELRVEFQRARMNHDRVVENKRLTERLSAVKVGLELTIGIIDL